MLENVLIGNTLATVQVIGVCVIEKQKLIGYV